ncbi:MAG: helix-turn-helix domain-containing protein [Bacteroidota bacterium]
MFEYNEWSAPLLPGFLQGLVFAVILLIRGYREERISDYFAALLLIAGSMYVGQWMLGFAGWYDAHDWRTTLMFYVEWKNLLVFGPLIWLYFRALTNTDFRWERKYWWHFLPLGIVLLQPLFIFLYDFGYWRLINGEPFTFFYDTRGPLAELDNSDIGSLSILFDVIFVFSFLHLIYYLIKTLLDYRKYRSYLDREFSNAEQLTFSSLKFTLYLMLLGVATTLVLEIGNYLFSTSYVDSWDSYFAMSVLNFLVAIQFLAINPRLTRALRFSPNREIAKPVEKQKQSIKSSAEKEKTDAELQVWANKLETHLQEHRDYLNPDLKMGELAESIGTNTSVMSRVINSIYGKNFNDFINAHRCEAFIRMIREGAHHRHTLLSIALDCGFNSKSTFNRAFKKHAGISPGEAVKREMVAG